jgi:hypothetical protein
MPPKCRRDNRQTKNKRFSILLCFDFKRKVALSSVQKEADMRFIYQVPMLVFLAFIIEFILTHF